jgi:hypothetical protein
MRPEFPVVCSFRNIVIYEPPCRQTKCPPVTAPPGVITTEVVLPDNANADVGAVVLVPALPHKFPFASNTITPRTYPPDTDSVTGVVSVDEKSPYSNTSVGAIYAFPLDVIVVAITPP